MNAPSSDFIAFAIGPNALVRTQAIYAKAAYIQTGYPNGPLAPEDLNKSLRQATVMGAAIAQVAVNLLGQSVLDDGNFPKLIEQLTLLFAGAGSNLLTAADSFASSAGPFPLSQTPDGKVMLVFFDGIEQPTSNWSLLGQEIVLGDGVDYNLLQTIRVNYSYKSSSTLRVQRDSFAIASPGPYTLTQTPNGNLILVFFDGIEQPGASYSIVGKILTILADPTFLQTVRIIYAY